VSPTCPLFHKEPPANVQRSEHQAKRPPPHPPHELPTTRLHGPDGKRFVRSAPPPTEMLCEGKLPKLKKFNLSIMFGQMNSVVENLAANYVRLAKSMASVVAGGPNHPES